MSMISYAQNYEDVMLVRALADISEGFYVDVGAQHPINGSVTKAFQLRGWRGVNIEPVERWFRLICDDRPKDINLNTLISDVPGYVDLFDVEDTGLSTTRQDYAESYTKDGRNVVQKKLKAHTLNGVFRAYAPKDVHFLKVDVEGAEAAVLRSLDLSRFRPWIILVEATKPNSPEPVFGDWEPKLLNGGYIFAYDDGLNRFYVASEHEDLAKHFSRPPNFFDDFMCYSESWARAQMDRLSQELKIERAAAQRVSERLQNMQIDSLNGLDERLVTFGGRLKHLAGRLDGLEGALERAQEHEIERAEAERVRERLQNMQVDNLNGLDERLVTFGERFKHLASRLDGLEGALERVHERVCFADKVQVALLDALDRERVANLKLQEILRSRSWRITRGPRFIARVFRAMLRRESVADAGLNKATAIRLLVAATKRPALRRIGGMILSVTPGYKARLVRVVVNNAHARVPVPVPPVSTLDGRVHLPGRARIVRSMLDSEMESS